MNPKKIIIYGASNFGYEVADMIHYINSFNNKNIYEIVGFIDDNFEGVKNGIPVLGNKKWIEQNSISEYYFVCAIGNPHIKSKITSFIESKGGQFTTLIHPSSIISETAKIGNGCIIMAGTFISTLATLNDHVILNAGTKIGHNTIVGNYCTFNSANVSGDNKINKGVLLGASSILLEKLEIGEFSIISAGSLVTSNIPENVTAVGFPARVMRKHDAK